MEWVGPVSYLLQQPGKRAPTQLYHINLLKCWIKPALAPLSSSIAGTTKPVHKGPELTPEQHQELLELKEQFLDVFSKEPGCTHLLQHHNKTSPDVVIPEARQQASITLAVS